MQIITLVSCQMHLHFLQHPTRHKVPHIAHQGEAPETKHTQLIHNRSFHPGNFEQVTSATDSIFQ